MIRIRKDRTKIVNGTLASVTLESVLCGDGERRFINAVMKGHGCTCDPVGDGTTRHPLGVDHCDLHAAARDMLHELGKLADALSAGEAVRIEPGSVKAAGILAAVARVGAT